MNEAHIHLMINHLPVIGLLIASTTLAVSLIRSSGAGTRIGLWLVLFTALSAVPVYFSGEGTEDVVEHLSGVSEDLIEEHEEIAEVGLILSQVTGLLALLTLLSVRGSDRLLKKGGTVTLVAALISFAVFGVVANTGGKISHPELRTDFQSEESSTEKHHDDEHDD
jgi:hypothetical protein